MIQRLVLLSLPVLLAQCTTVKSVTQPVVSGARKIWPWAKEKPAEPPTAAQPDQATAAAQPAPALGTTPGTADPAFPKAHRFPTGGLLVTDAELGPDAVHMEEQSVVLDDGWILAGPKIAYALGPGSIAPTAVRAAGTSAQPATARSSGASDATVASARELHYHAATGVLVLRGDVRLTTPSGRMVTTGANAQILIHLPTGAMRTEGRSRWES